MESPNRKLEVTEALLRALPKTDLHCHLDGSLRLSTLLELAAEQGVELPADDEASLARALHAGETVGSLEQYLEAFDLTLQVLQTAQALRRTAYELALDAWAEGVHHVEVRFAPLLHERQGLAPEAIVEAVVDGLAAARREVGVESGVILCAMRHLDPTESVRMARLAVAWRDRGVSGFDLAGAEKGFPAGAHEAAYRLARSHGLGCTCHAGESDGAASIAEALHRCGAHRIGHGVRLREDEALLGYVNDHRVPLECCPSSNVQTGAVASLEVHPLADYLRRGLRVTVNTDNRLISDTTVTKELLLLHRHCGLGLDELIRCVANGWKSAFLPLERRREKLAQLQAAVEGIRAA